jgi:N-methylhydantoinase B
MIRDQHDYRVALFDAKGRKLTGRSYSAIVEPVFQYFSDDIEPGDVFFWNDPYNSCGGIGHVPDLCTTVPIFVGERLIGFGQVFGHRDDVGGSVPGSLPVHADSWMEGVLVPRSSSTSRASSTGRPSASSPQLALKAPGRRHGRRDRRRPARLAPHRRWRTAGRRAEAAFEQISEEPPRSSGARSAKIKDGVYHCEDYIEADGVDAPQSCAPHSHDQDAGRSSSTSAAPT